MVRLQRIVADRITAIIESYARIVRLYLIRPRRPVISVAVQIEVYVGVRARGAGGVVVHDGGRVRGPGHREAVGAGDHAYRHRTSYVLEITLKGGAICRLGV